MTLTQLQQQLKDLADLAQHGDTALAMTWPNHGGWFASLSFRGHTFSAQALDPDVAVTNVFDMVRAAYDLSAGLRCAMCGQPMTCNWTAEGGVAWREYAEGGTPPTDTR